MSYLFNDAIINTYIDNTSCNLSYGIKISGKGLYDDKNLGNYYSCNGITLQLLNNITNSNNSNYSKKFSFTNTEILSRTVFDINNSNIGITALNSNNSAVLPLILNSNIYITNTSIGINTTIPQNYLHLHNNFNSNIGIQLTDSITGVNNSNGITIIKNSNQHLIINNNFDKGNIIIGNKVNPNVFIIDSNGFIGIGTNNPKVIFDLIGTVNIKGDINLNGLINKTDNTSYVSSQWSNSVINANNIYYNLGGVGIGTTNVNLIANDNDIKLSVEGGITCGKIYLDDLLINKSYIEYKGTNVGDITGGVLPIVFGGTGITEINNEQLVYGGISQLKQSENLKFFNESSNLFINGNIGIGTSNPKSTLHLHNNLSCNIKISLTDVTTGINTNNGFEISKTIDNSCRIWNYQNTKLSLATNNTEVITITNDGNVGIGSTSPSSKLDIGTGTFKTTGNIITPTVTSSGSLNINTTSITDPILFKTNSDEKVRITNDGNVGIGTTNITNNKLQVIGNIFSSSNITAKTSLITSLVKNDNDDLIIKTDTNNDLVFQVFNVEKLRLIKGGDVSTNNTNLTTGTGTITSLTSVNTPLLSTNSGSLNIRTTSSTDPITFQTSTTEKMRITNTGSIGIGTTNPLGILDIRGGNLIIPETNRYVGIGLTNPQYNLDVNGKINTTEVISSNITTSNLKVTGDTTILNTSVFITEQFELSNESNFTAIKVTQKNVNKNLIELYNNDYLSFIIDNNCNLGIGTTLPSQKLTINGNILTTGNISLSNASLNGDINSGLIINSFSNIAFNINSFEKLRINNQFYLPSLQYIFDNDGDTNNYGTISGCSFTTNGFNSQSYVISTINNVSSKALNINNSSSLSKYLYINKNNNINTLFILNSSFTLKFFINYNGNGFNICIGIKDNTQSLSYFELGSTISGSGSSLSISYWFRFIPNGTSVETINYFNSGIPVSTSKWYEIIYVKYQDPFTRTTKIDLYIDTIKQVTLDFPNIILNSNGYSFTIGASLISDTPTFDQNTQITNAIIDNIQVYSQDLINSTNVGIGITNPISKLHVNGKITAPELTSTNDLNITTANNITIKNVSGVGKGIIFESSVGESMRIQSDNGNIGIGTSSSITDKLTVNGNIKTSASLITSFINNNSGDLRIRTNTTNPIIFETGSSSSEIMRITQDGNVGIGTSSSISDKLTVSGNIKTSANLITSVLNNNSGDLRIRTNTINPIIFETGSSSSETMRITQEGNVGIGTSSSINDKLTVSGNIKTSGNLITSFINNNSGDLKIRTNTINPIIFETGSLSIETMRIFQDGNVGIGTSSVINSKLYVLGNTRTTGTLTADTSVITSVLNNNTGDLRIRTNTTNPIIFETGSSSSEIMRITQDGNVGIGTSSSISDKLTVNGNIKTSGNLITSVLNNNSGDLRIKTNTANAIIFETGSSSIETMRIFQDGNVGIGTSSSISDKLTVNGNIKTSENLTANTSIITPKMTNLGSVTIESTSGINDIVFLSGTGNNAEKMRITSSGRIGIGSTIPSATLDLGSGDIVTTGSIKGNVSLGGGSFSGNSTSGLIINSSSNILFNINSFERLRFNIPSLSSYLNWKFGNTNTFTDTNSSTIFTTSSTVPTTITFNSRTGINIGNTGNLSKYLYLDNSIIGNYIKENQDFTFKTYITYNTGVSGFNICFGLRNNSDFTFFELGSTISINGQIYTITYWINYLSSGSSAPSKKYFNIDIPVIYDNWYDVTYVKYFDSYSRSYKIDLYIDSVKQSSLDIPNINLNKNVITIGASLITHPTVTFDQSTQITNAIFSDMQLYSQDIINFMSIGIGVTNPISKFHVNGIITAPQINSTDDLNLLSTGTTNNIKIRTNSSTVGKGVIFESGIGEVMRIQANNGFIGIGTTNAQSLLHLHNNNQSGIVQINLTNGSSGAANTDGFAIIKNGNEDCFVWNYENTNLSFATNNLERIKILAGGNVGIGTSTISEKLHVSGNLLVSGNDSSSGNITAGKSVTTPIITSGTGNTSLTIKTETTNDIIFQTNNSEQMRYVHSTQRLGIGSAIPLQRLDLGNGNIRLNEIFKMDTNISNIFVTSNALKNLQNLVNYNNINGIPIISDPVYLDPNNKLTLKLDNPFIIADNSDPTKTGKLQLNLDTSTLQINADGTVGVVNVILNRTQTSNLFTTKTESNLIWNALEYAGVWTINNTNNIYNRLSGNVGIGSTTPTEKLTVNGNILASGNITGNGLSGNINNNLNVNSFNNMLFNINSIERMRINIPQYLPYLSYNLNNNLNYSGTDTNFNLIYSSPTTPIYLSINNITGIYINNISATNYIYINNSFINSRYINNTFTLKFSINYPSINGFNICFGLNNNSGSVNYFELGSTINQDNTINYWISYVVTSGSLANKFYFSIAIPIIRINVWHDLIYVKYLDVITKTYKIDLFINNIKQTTLDIPEFNVTANILTIGATYTGGTPLFNQNTQITDAIFTNLQLYSQDLINFINVGIGVNNPSSKLHVNGTITAPQINSIGDLNLSSSGTTNNITIKTNTLTPGKGIIFESGIGEVMRIQTNDGNVGIGSSASLVDKLTVIGNIRSSGRIITSEIASTGDLTIIPNNTNTNSIIFKSGTASLERMRIFPSGFVGIGTTERVNLSLYVVGDILSTASLIAPTLMNSNNNDLKIRNITNTNIIFENGSSSLEFMRITSDGKVGIGSSVPRDKLDLGAGNLLTSGTITTANITTSTITTGANVSDLIIKNLSDNKNIVFQTTSGSSERMKILSSGNVGIGVTLDANITSRLTVAGTARITVSPDQTGGTLVVDNSITTSNINNNTNNLKIRTTTANDIIFETGSSSIEYMRITSGGRVGIGSSVPTAMLDLGSGSLTTTGIITGNLNLTGDLDVGKVKNTKNNSDFKISNIFANTNIIFEIGGSSTEYMRITSAGRVGIGSSVPQERLDLGNGNLLTSGTIKTSSIISPNITTGANVSDLEIKTEGDKGIIFKTGSGSTEKMQIFSGGNVGIGTTNNPLVKLYVVGSIRAATDTNTSIANIRADTSLISPILTAGTTGIGTSLFIRTETDNDVIFHTGSTLTEKMRLRFDGNLGIGTSIPTSKLQVFGDISSTGTGNITATSSVKTPLITTDDNLLLRSLTTNKDIIFQTTATINSAIITSERMRILSSGNVGIGVTLNSSITSTLTVGGTARITVSPVDQTGGTLLVDNSITTSSINNNTNNLKIRTTTANDIIFETGLNSIEYMRITSGGRVGIGSSVPKEALDLGSANIITSGNITGNIISTGGAFSSNLTTGSIINSTSNIIFNIGSFERMRINLPISLNNFYWSFNGNLNNSGSYSTGSTSFIVQSGTSASYSSGNSGIIINNSANPSTSSYIYLNTVSGIANTYFNQNFTFAFSINYIGNGFNICFGTRTTNSYTFFELGSTITVNIISYWINYFNGTSVNKVNFATNIPFSLNTWYNLMYIKYKDSFTGNYKIDLYINNIKQITLDIPNIIVSSDGIAIGSSIILVSSSSITVATIANLTQTTNAIFSNMSLFQDDLLNITNVGIGITNPSSKLHVNGSITAPQLISSSNLTLTANSLTTPADIIFFTNTSEKMRIYSSGNVGIGTTREPSVRLFVGGNFTSSGLILGSNLSTDRLFNNNNLNIETSDVKDIIFSTITSAGNSITEKVRIFANGNVGIGSSTTFSSKLYVVGDITTTGTLITNTSIITPVITTGAVTRDLIIKTDTVNDIIFSTVTSGTSSSSEKLRILSGGNIGIGTSTNVNTKLYIYGDTTTTGNLYANTSVITPKITTASTLAIETSGASDITFASKNSSQSAVSEKMRITSLGNVGIGITSSINDKLHVVGSIKTTTSLTADTSVITPTLTTNGLLTISTTGTNTNILFSTNGTTTPASRNAMTIFSNGGVGIGVTTLTNSVSLDVAGTVKATTFSGNLTGNVTGNCSGSSGSCTGNAATANNLVNGNFSFNAGTGTISATTFVGNVTGNCSGSSGSCTGNAATANNLVNGNFSFSAGTGTITARTFSGNLNGTVNGIDVTSSKNLNPLIDVWHNSTDNRNRFYFANGGRTYFGSGNGYEWRNSADNQIMILENNGALSCTHITIPSGGVINFGEGDGRIYRTGGNVYIESDDIIYFKTAGSIITFNSGTANFPGMITGNITGNAGGLTGTPAITVQDITCRTINSSSSITLDGEIRNARWRLMNDPDNWCRLYRRDSDTYYNFAANEIYAASTIHGSITGRADNARYADSANYANSAGSAGGIYGNPNVDLNALYCSGTRYGGTRSDTGYWFTGSSSTGTNYTRWNYSYGLIVEQDLWVRGGFWLTSDERIKKNIQDIKDDNALRIILDIEPKTFEYIDFVKHGSQKEYGFISQQIDKIIPEAIKKHEGYIPNIFKLLELNKNQIIFDKDITNDFKINDSLQLIDEKNNNIFHNIINIDKNIITIDTILENNKIFVYGKKVEDFHTIDKTYIFTLNVCATQELHRIIQSQKEIIDSHEKRISDLEEKINRLINSNI